MRSLIFLLSIFFPVLVFAQDMNVYEIRTEEVWEGEKLIEGVVAVRKSGKLTIKAGTKVVFLPVDLDRDGIGDGEIYVEGELYILGEKDSPVIFTAKAEKIEPSLWKYLMINHAKYAFINYAIFEGAFSGVQIHFTKADVKNSVFRKNIDGFRFSTANIYVCNCLMTENKHGIRYEERDSRGTIHFNEIKNNEIGIFPVIKSESRVRFEYNNIYDNEYNIKIGDEQKKDIIYSNNYFEFSEEQKIRKKIYDKSKDKNLPSAIIKPFLNKKVKLGEHRCQ